jgi:hypothetical protein
MFKHESIYERGYVNATNYYLVDQKMPCLNNSG